MPRQMVGVAARRQKRAPPEIIVERLTPIGAVEAQLLKGCRHTPGVSVEVEHSPASLQAPFTTVEGLAVAVFVEVDDHTALNMVVEMYVILEELR